MSMSAMKKVNMSKTNSRNNLNALRATRASLNKSRSPKIKKSKFTSLPRITSEIDHIFDEAEIKAMARMKIRKNSKERRFSLAEIGPIGQEIISLREENERLFQKQM